MAKSAQKAGKDFVGTVVGQLVGSPAYMSPEQAQGSLDVDFRSDLFSLAVVAYHCLTGVVPFSGNSLAEILIGIVSKDPILATRLTPRAAARARSMTGSSARWTRTPRAASRPQRIWRRPFSWRSVNTPRPRPTIRRRRRP